VRKLKGCQAHHLRTDKVSPLSKGEGPSIAMLPADHVRTASFGKSAKAQTFRQAQKKLVDNGEFQPALAMGVRDVRERFPGRYEEAIRQAKAHSSVRGH